MSDLARVALQPAYVLHRRPYRDTSLLLELFTLDHGRVGMVARGVRKAKGSQQALLQPFVPLLVSWSSRGDLVTMTGVESRPAFPPLAGLGLICGFYLNELLLHLLHRHEPHEVLFAAYELALTRLAGGQENQEWSLRLFEKALLQELGYGLLLEHEAESGAAIRADRSYTYLHQYGPVPDDSPHPGIRVHGATLIALEQEERYDAQVLHEAKRLMRHELQAHLGNRQLHSRELFRDTIARRDSRPGGHNEDESRT